MQNTGRSTGKSPWHVTGRRQVSSVIDLHLHSTASDGSLSPSELIQSAFSQGLEAVSITDHDTTDGIRQAFEAGIPQVLEFITGVEISTAPPVGIDSIGSLHVLGYGFSIYDRPLCHALEKLRNARADRNPQIIRKLVHLGFNLTMDEIRSLSGDAQLGRPHIAKAMVAKGFVSTIDEAFDQFLSKGRPAYVDKYRIPCEEAINLIRNAGGVAVLAHPGLLRDAGSQTIETLVDTMISLGLKGIEVYYTDHTREETDYFADLARRKNLLSTGGTDFHGDLKKGTVIGSGNGDLNIDYCLFKLLVSEVDAHRLQNSSLDILETNLGYRFTDRSLLENALNHSSYVNELPDKTTPDNQRLEFLGDAVLGLAIGQMIMEHYPEMNEGSLSKLRASLVSETGLAAMARQIDLGRFICLGKGERLSRGYEKNSILADAFEAVVAAMYLDQGFKPTYALIQNLFSGQISSASPESDLEDYKSVLQEYAQEMGHPAPSYAISGETGPDHDKTFDIAVTVCEITSVGSGKSKKAAEQNAAQQALRQLKLMNS